MKLQKYLAILPLAAVSFGGLAQAAPATFNFSTEIQREVEKDLMQAEVFARQSGKNLSELKQKTAAALNQVLEKAKAHSVIQLEASGINNYADYNEKGKVIGWVAEGRISLRSQNFEALAAILDNLGDNVAVAFVDFSVSPEKMRTLEDEMTLEALKQFQHKAEVIKQGLNAGSYQLKEIQLESPNGYHHRPVAYAMRAAKSADYGSEMPLEAGKVQISARASGSIVVE